MENLGPVTLVFQIPPEVRCLSYVLGVQIPTHKVFGSLGLQWPKKKNRTPPQPFCWNTAFWPNMPFSLIILYRHVGLFFVATGLSAFWRFEVHSGARTCCGSGRHTSVEKQRVLELSSKFGRRRNGRCLVGDVPSKRGKQPKQGGKRCQTHWHSKVYSSIAFLLTGLLNDGIPILCAIWSSRLKPPIEKISMFFNKQTIIGDGQRAQSHCNGEDKSAIEMELIHPSTT